MVIVGGRYRHFKGREYEVLMLAKDCESLRDVVVYRALYGEGQVWTRDLEEFDGFKKFEDGREVKRFELVDGKS